MELLPLERRPIAGTAGADYRKKQMAKQLPDHDQDHERCHELSPGEVKQMQQYVRKYKDEALGIGDITLPEEMGQQADMAGEKGPQGKHGAGTAGTPGDKGDAIAMMGKVGAPGAAGMSPAGPVGNYVSMPFLHACFANATLFVKVDCHGWIFYYIQIAFVTFLLSLSLFISMTLNLIYRHLNVTIYSWKIHFGAVFISTTCALWESNRSPALISGFAWLT